MGKVIVVMPAYNAASTLVRTYEQIPNDLVSEVLLVVASHDETVNEARKLNIPTLVHPENRGYGANQKTCYTEALRRGANIVVMLHPDYQYDPTLIPEMIQPIQEGKADLVLGSRLLGVDGLLFEPGNVQELAVSMRRLIHDPGLAGEMGRRGRAKMEERFSMETYMESLLGVYRRVLGRA